MAGQVSQASAAAARSASAANPSLDYINGHSSLPDAPNSTNAVNNSVPAPATAAPAATKKAMKGKKATDPNETGKLLAAKINQLELDAVEEKDQELEIGSCYVFLLICSFFIVPSARLLSTSTMLLFATLSFRTL